MTIAVALDFLAAGGNRHPSAADWTEGLFAFGAGINLAVWQPNSEPVPVSNSDGGGKDRGIIALLPGHTDTITAVKIVPSHPRSGRSFILTGGADHSVRVWEVNHRTSSAGSTTFTPKAVIPGHHSASINVIATLPTEGLFVTGGADAQVKVCALSDDGEEVQVVQSIALQPRFLPLACALTVLDGGAVVLAVAGTCATISLFVRENPGDEFVLQATLAGHEGWIRSLDFTLDGASGDVLLASASQDKYIRLWRFRRGEDMQVNGHAATDVIPGRTSLSNRAERVGASSSKFTVTFEALLIGHEDWIYTAKWSPQPRERASPVLLSASADNSLSMWSADESSGLWVCHTRLGEISSQKGSTTATGSTGGFWIGLWQPDGHAVVSLGRTGSWRRWQYDSMSDAWKQQIGISGHTEEVRSIAWAPDGSYLLSTGADQTTRVFAEWKRDGERSWHEFARPQIHGYDLNCIDTLSNNQFTSGADEKLLRVFNKPKPIDDLMAKLSGTAPTVTDGLPSAADIPVLGLSNKAIATTQEDNNINEDGTVDAPNPSSTLLDLSHPPLEEHLSRQTLWPEHEKLYGHGYEISTVSANRSGTLIATACKASSAEHAVIRLYETTTWRELRPALTAHSLTVTGLAFSPDEKYLLSVGRDRQWALFQQSLPESDTAEKSFIYKLSQSNPKGHTRMILDCAWAPFSGAGGRYLFATAGRDKCIKLWSLPGDSSEGSSVTCIATLPATSPVTAVAFALDFQSENGNVWLAYGTDEGIVAIVEFDTTTEKVVETTLVEKDRRPSKAVTAVRWRPGGVVDQLAVGSEDCAVRVYTVETVR